MGQVRIDYTPRQWQAACHANRKRFTVLAIHRRAGKALDVDTLIPMADGGFKRNGDLQDGDRVFDETGKPCTVLEAHPVMHNRPCVEMRFSDGTNVVCDEDHLWFTQTKLDRAHRVGRVVDETGRMSSGWLEPRPGGVRTAKAIESSLAYGGEVNHVVPLAGPVVYGKQEDLPIEPYMFGLWLGDGHSNGSQITTMDEEVLQAVLEYARDTGQKVRRCNHQNSGQAETYRVVRGATTSCLQAVLRKMGMLRNKHIPEHYFSASISQRKALLAGLMDTDGTIDIRKSVCDITLKANQLAIDVVRLVRSLGLRPHTATRKINGRDYTRITFAALFNPFRLKRKAQLWREPKAKWTRYRKIVDVVRVPSRPVRCITVDSPNKLYLCSESFIPTHNTHLGLMELIDKALAFEKPLGTFVYLAPLLKQAENIAWARLKQFLQPLYLTGAIEIREGDLEVRFKHNGAKIRLFGANNPDEIRGMGLDGVVIDEVAQIDPHVWEEIVQPTLSDRLGWALFIGTPKGINLFSELYFLAEEDPDWHAARFAVYDTETLDPDEVARLKKTMTPNAFAREYLCDFMAASQEQVLSLTDVEEAARRQLKETDFIRSPRIIGVDPARFGDDRSVIAKRQGLQAFESIVLQDVDNMELASRVAAEIEDWRPQAVFIDAGAGAGVIDRLRQLGHSIIEVPFGGKANKRHYVNRRTEMWFNMADWIRSGGSIPDSWSLKQELATPIYSFDNDQKKLESKEHIKRRLAGRASPDEADALALTFAAQVAPSDPMEEFVRQFGEGSRPRTKYNPFGRDAAARRRIGR